MITCLSLGPALDVTYGVARLQVGQIHRPTWQLAVPGGKAVNVARALRTLGGAGRVILPLGGPIGQLVQNGLQSDGIAAVVVPAAADTRTCVSIVDDASGAATEVYEHPAEVDDRAWDGLVAALDDVTDGWLAVSGSVPPARCRDLGDALAAAAGRGVRLALDVTGALLRDALARARPAVVKVNRSEAGETFGPADAGTLARRLHAAGATVAVVTDGAAGAVGVDAIGAWRVQPTVRGRYAVGSGDSFLAGLLDVLSGGGSLEDALRRATGAGAANTLAPGAGRFQSADAARLAAEATVVRA